MAQKPALPAWMTQNLYDQQGAIDDANALYRNNLGSADADQFQASLPNQAYKPGYVSHAPNVSPGFHSPQSGYQPAAGMAGINQKGQAGRYEAPSAGDRVQRALKGALTGPDTGSKVGNLGVGLAAKAAGPAGMVGRSVAGGIQGAKSNTPVFKTGGAPAGDAARPTALGNLPVAAPNAAPGGDSARLGGSQTSLLDQEGGLGAVEPRQRGTRADGSVYPGAEVPSDADATLLDAEEAPAETAPEEGSQFTGGSGKPVDPYSLPEEDALAAYLAGGQSYGGYDASTGRTGTAASGINGYSAHGFDFGQDPGNRDIGKSAKYAFAHFANQAATNGKPMPKNHAEAEAWFNENILPGFQQLGYTVNWVQGDKAEINTREGTYVVDFLSDSGGSNPQLWWGADTPEQAALNAAMQGGGGASGGGGDAFESRTAKLGVADTGNGALDSYAQQIVNMLLEREALDGAMAEGGGQYERRYDRLRSFV